MAYERLGLKDFDRNNPFAAKHVDHLEDGIVQNESDIDTLSADLTDITATIDSGSILDITKSGIYYVRNSVTDKPTSQGGLYILSYYSASYHAGIFIPTLRSSTNVPYVMINGTWLYSLSTSNTEYSISADSLSELVSAVSALETYETRPCYISSSGMSEITSGTISVAGYGVVCKQTSTVIDFTVNCNYSCDRISGRITSGAVSYIYRLSGTALSTTSLTSEETEMMKACKAEEGDYVKPAEEELI